MTWLYWDWVVCNILIGFGVILLTYSVSGILLWHFDQVFYSIVAKLFNITRCVIDVNHTVIRENAAIFTSHPDTRKTGRFVSKFCRCCMDTTDKKASMASQVTILTSKNCFSRLCRCVREATPHIETEGVTRVVSRSTRIVPLGLVHYQTAQKELAQISSIVRESGLENNVSRRSFSANRHMDNTVVTEPVSASTMNTTTKITRNHPSHPDYEREVLNMYGRYLTLTKKRNKLLVMTIGVIVIASVIIAAIEGCILASITVYPDGPCPAFGLMDCYHGSNFTYFSCTPGTTINFSLYSSSATCFRWIAHDALISNVVTQIGVCTGLLTAFGAVVEVLIRLLLFVFQQRRGVATGIRRLLEKTVGINRITQPTRCCGITLAFHFGILDLRLYQRPWLVVIFIILYILLPLTVVGSIILLSYFKISITSLTYIILLTIMLICCLALLWIIWEEDEIGRMIPGAWHDFEDIVSQHQLGKFAMVGQGVASGNDLRRVTGRVGNILPKSEVKLLTGIAQTTSQNAEVLKNLTGSTQEVRSRKETA